MTKGMAKETLAKTILKRHQVNCKLLYAIPPCIFPYHLLEVRWRGKLSRIK